MDEQPPPPPSGLTPPRTADGVPSMAAKGQQHGHEPSALEGAPLHSMRPLKREGSFEKLRRSLTGSLGGLGSPHGFLRRMVSVGGGKTPPPSPQKDTRV